VASQETGARETAAALFAGGSLQEALGYRVGRVHLRQRLGIESEHEAQIFGQGIKFFHLENWYSVHSLIRASLRLVGLYRRARRNALDICVLRNDISLPGLPKAFDGYIVVHISDPHVDMSWDTTHALIERVRDVDYDLCVLTGDFRAKTFGPYQAALEGMERLRLHLKDPIYGVLGNHDTIKMVPRLEDLGIRMLQNEAMVVERITGQASTSRVSTMRITTVWITCRRPPTSFPTTPYRSCFPIRLSPTARRPTPISMRCSVAIPTEARSACPRSPCTDCVPPEV